MTAVRALGTHDLSLPRRSWTGTCAAYLLGPLGLYLVCFFLFYALGPEWKDPEYAHVEPTSQRFVFLFWICIVLVLLLGFKAVSFMALVASQLVLAFHGSPAFGVAHLLWFSVILALTCVGYLYLTRTRLI